MTMPNPLHSTITIQASHQRQVPAGHNSATANSIMRTARLDQVRMSLSIRQFERIADKKNSAVQDAIAVRG